jgi:hypothetical protein
MQCNAFTYGPLTFLGFDKLVALAPGHSGHSIEDVSQPLRLRVCCEEHLTRTRRALRRGFSGKARGERPGPLPTVHDGQGIRTTRGMKRVREEGEQDE